MTILKRIYLLLQADERKKAGRIVASVFATALLDLIGLAALLPMLYFLMEESGEKDKSAFFLYFCLPAVMVILLKCVLSTLLTRYRNRCLLAFYRRLSFSMNSAYCRRGLLFVRGQGSNRLAHEVNAVCYAFSHHLLASVCRMAGDLLLTVFITLALWIWNGATVLILYASFLPFMVFYFFGVRKRVKEYGTEDMEARREQARVVTDTFRGYAELEVNGAFAPLQQSFLKGMDRISASRLKLDTLLQLPLLLSELSAVLALALLVGFGNGDVKMLISLFAVAAFRLLPALRNILTGWTQIQNAACCLDIIEQGMGNAPEEPGTPTEEIGFTREITMQQLTYTYPDGITVLKDFGCTVRKGEYVGFRGPSGTGKTTLFNLLTGLLEPTSGEIRIDGTPLTRSTCDSWRRQLGYVPQEVFVFDGTLAENIALGGGQPDRFKVAKLLEQVALSEWVETLPKGMDTPMSEAGAGMSGGQRQRIGIARALYRDASVLLLDEATSALDNETESGINQTLKQLKAKNAGLTILSIAHRDSSLGYCNRIVNIEKYEQNI